VLRGLCSPTAMPSEKDVEKLIGGAKLSAQMSRPSFMTRQLSVISPADIFLRAPRAPSTNHSKARSSAPDETSICVRRQTRARLKTIVSCGSHASFAESRLSVSS